MSQMMRIVTRGRGVLQAMPKKPPWYTFFENPYFAGLYQDAAVRNLGWEIRQLEMPVNSEGIDFRANEVYRCADKWNIVFYSPSAGGRRFGIQSDSVRRGELFTKCPL